MKNKSFSCTSNQFNGCSYSSDVTFGPTTYKKGSFILDTLVAPQIGLEKLEMTNFLRESGFMNNIPQVGV